MRYCSQLGEDTCFSEEPRREDFYVLLYPEDLRGTEMVVPWLSACCISIRACIHILTHTVKIKEEEERRRRRSSSFHQVWSHVPLTPG